MLNKHHLGTMEQASSASVGRYRRNFRRSGAALGAVLLAAVVCGCAGETTRHGQIMTEADAAQVQPGMSKEQVQLALGSPSTKSTAGNDVYYYISMTTNTPVAFMSPRVVDRRVLAVYFDKKESVARVANYSLQDGKVIDTISRQTPSYGSDDGILRELFRNIGRPQPTVAQDTPY